MDKEARKPSSKSASSKDKRPKDKDKDKAKDDSKVHKLSLKGSSRLVAEFVFPILDTHNPIPTRRLPSRRFYSRQEIWPQHARYYYLPPKTSTVKHETDLPIPYSLVSADDQVKAYIKKIMSQLDKWMIGGKISKLVIVITDKDTGEHVERWQFDVQISAPPPKSKSKPPTDPSAPITAEQEHQQENASSTNNNTPFFAEKDKPEAEIQAEIAAIFRQITASVTFLPQLSGDCTFNVLVYADADSDVPVEWGDSDAKEIENGERVQLRGFSTANHRVDTLVSYRLGD
ncbi:Mitotic spindle checkpoint component mad2 [Trichoderma lentiforme]|uniref:Mitotic spindle checkpoint component mad2 n=1 Tax=Trichoderma lentiforme TaxID=1567552 RepID=A0A9P4XE51_9HYPO|nr:Mitotic spindle checkpoint component mad2 [Trichoderma lentiforme]